MVIRLRRATPDDAFFIWKLRNSKQGRAVSIQEGNIKLSDHKAWFARHYEEYQIVNGDKGFVRTDADGFVSIMLEPGSQGKGFGKRLLERMSGKAIIKLDNPASYHAFVRAGWKLKAFYLEKRGFERR